MRDTHGVTFQRLYNAASQNPKVPLEEIRDYLRALRRDLDVNPSCWKSTGLKNLKQYTDDESHSLDAYRKPAADATFPRHNRVSAPAESSGDDSSLTSQSNSFGPKE